MAKNYTLTEAVEIIAKGTDLEAMADIGKRFPVLAIKVANVAAKAGESFVDLMNYMPEHLTANKVNTVIKNSFAEGDAESDEDADAEETTEATETAGTDYESMSGKELVKLLRKAGKGSLITSKKKADLVDLCNKVFGDSTEAEDEVEEETEENPYEGKTAQELFKECKKRGLKAEAKKSAKFYTEILMKDDAEDEAEDADADADDWDDDEEEAPAPKEEKKPAKKAEKKTEKKSEKKAPKKAEVEDDDDDWDI